LEKPHCGINFEPFIKTKIGLVAIKLSMRDLVEASMTRKRGLEN
jgi:uncharacterized protein (UPF0212 family)